MDNEERIIELETRMIYAENTIDELNKVVALQSREIESLRKFCAELQNKLNDLRDISGGSMEHVKPPHY